MPGAGIRREREAAQARLRMRCPPHKNLYDDKDVVDRRPVVRCGRCYKAVARGALVQLQADPGRLAAVIAGEGGFR